MTGSEDEVAAAADQAPRAEMGARPISPLELSLLSIFLGAYIFDFRSETPGGHWSQYVFLATSTLSFIALYMALLQRKARTGVYDFSWFPLVMSVLLPAYAMFGAFYNGVEFGNFARLELRFVLFFESIVLVYMLGRAGISLDVLIKPILISALIALAWSIYHTLYVQEMSVDLARYRLAPTFTVSIVGICVAALYTGRIAYVFPLYAALFAIQLSSTRAYLAALAAIYAMMHVYAISGRERRKLIGMCVVDGVLIAIILYLYSRGYFENWVDRFVLNRTRGGDATLLTRLAEYQSQWNFLTASWSNAFFGGGLGSNYVRDLGVMRLAILSHHVALDDVSTFEFGHSLWIYSAYYGGILGGWMLPLVIIAVFVRSAGNAFRSHRNGDRRRYLIDLQCNAIIVQVMVIGLFSHPFATRLFCVQLGLLTALTFIYPSQPDSARKSRRARNRRRARRPKLGQAAIT